MTQRLAVLIVVLAFPVVLPRLIQAQHSPTIVSLGTCQLESGASVPDCRIAYRSFGELNGVRSNTVLIPTWLLGRSEDWTSLLGPDGYVDTTRFYVLVVDALGNGRSSSPSTVPVGARDAFRGLTIGDMVQSQHRLLVEHLGIFHLHAVVGYSMGGMQAFEWVVRYPAFMDLAVPIAGSPRVGAFDHLRLTTMLEEIETAQRERTPVDSVWGQLARLEALFLRTPLEVNKSSWDSVLTDAGADAKELSAAWSLEDYAAQLRAILRHDISTQFNFDLVRASTTVKARMLIIHSPDDHMVTAGPAVQFAPLVRAKTLWIPSSCGHMVLACERKRIAAAIREFLAP